MSRRHFQMIAAVLRDATLTPKQRDDLAERFAVACKRENPRFDRQRFLTAINGQPSTLLGDRKES
jgi:hypothetical protein